MAGEPGFEPRLKVLETSVLPLYYSPINCFLRRSAASLLDSEILIYGSKLRFPHLRVPCIRPLKSDFSMNFLKMRGVCEDTPLNIS